MDSRQNTRARLLLVLFLIGAIAVVLNSSTAFAERPSMTTCGEGCTGSCSSGCFCVNGNQWCEDENTCSGWPCSEEDQCGSKCHCYNEPYGWCEPNT
jgi:hypothetical protein